MNLIHYVENLSEPFNKIAASHGAVKFSEECHHAKQLLQENDFLAKIASANPESLKNAILSVASAGITLNPVHKKVYLVPRKGRVCLDVSYRGMLSLVAEGGGISWMQVNLVKEKDTFEIVSASESPIHKFQPFLDRGAIVGGYALTKLANGDYLTHTVTIDRMHEIRERSEAYKRNSGPWVTDYEEMLKKTIVKSACKMLPEHDLGSRAIHAIEAENDANGIDFEEEKKPKEIEGPSPAQVSEQKDEIIKQIGARLGEITQGCSMEEKGTTLFLVTGVKSFGLLKNLKISELEAILKRANERQPKKPAEKVEEIDEESLLERLRNGVGK